MKVPPKRKGNGLTYTGCRARAQALNESPSEKEGKSENQAHSRGILKNALNESPSEKEGKCGASAGLT